jgi:hypothetical protein
MQVVFGMALMLEEEEFFVVDLDEDIRDDDPYSNQPGERKVIDKQCQDNEKKS